MIKQKLVLYGAGKRCEKIYKQLRQCSNIEVIAILDSNPDKWRTKVEGYPVEAPERMKDFKDANICITVLTSTQRPLTVDEVPFVEWSGELSSLARLRYSVPKP